MINFVVVVFTPEFDCKSADSRLHSVTQREMGKFDLE